MTDITITGHLDGFALWMGGVVIEVFPNLDAAIVGRRVARQALADLEAVFRQSNWKYGDSQ